MVATAVAQTTGTVSGLVQDPSGAAVIGAEVTLSNPATGLSRASTSNESGYSFGNLPLGNYQLRVIHRDFAEQVANITVRSGVPLEINVALQVRGSAEQLEVSYSNVFAQVEPELTGTRNQ